MKCATLHLSMWCLFCDAQIELKFSRYFYNAVQLRITKAPFMQQIGTFQDFLTDVDSASKTQLSQLIFTIPERFPVRYLWGFSRLQNKGVKFCSMQKFTLPMPKIFEAYVINFSKFSRNQIPYPTNIFWQRRRKCEGCKDFFSACKNFCMKLQKPFFALRKPGLLYDPVPKGITKLQYVKI